MPLRFLPTRPFDQLLQHFPSRIACVELSLALSRSGLPHYHLFSSVPQPKSGRLVVLQSPVEVQVLWFSQWRSGRAPLPFGHLSSLLRLVVVCNWWISVLVSEASHSSQRREHGCQVLDRTRSRSTSASSRLVHTSRLHPRCQTWACHPTRRPCWQ